MPNLVTLTLSRDLANSDFRIPGQSLIKKIVLSRTSNGIDMKLRPLTKLDKRNTATCKKLDNDVILANCDIVVIFQINGQFGPIGSRILDASYVNVHFY